MTSLRLRSYMLLNQVFHNCFQWEKINLFLSIQIREFFSIEEKFLCVFSDENCSLARYNILRWVIKCAQETPCKEFIDHRNLFWRPSPIVRAFLPWACSKLTRGLMKTQTAPYPHTALVSASSWVSPDRLHFWEVPRCCCAGGARAWLWTTAPAAR